MSHLKAMESAEWRHLVITKWRHSVTRLLCAAPVNRRLTTTEDSWPIPTARMCYFHNNCLYASDYNYNTIYKVELSGNNSVMKWSVARCPVGLSVNSEHNLLVVSSGESKLRCRYSRLMELSYTQHSTQLQAILDRLYIPRMLCSCLPVNFWSVIPAHYIASV